MASGPTIFDVRGVSKHFGGIAALSEVGFTVRAGEVLGLIGPNGAGKTTLFECLAGILPVDQGAIYVDDRAVGAERRKALLFYVPDTIAPWPSQSVQWALEYVIGFFDGSAASRPIVIEQLGLHPLLHQLIGTLSKGQRKRVLLAIGLLTPVPVLLIDEPFDGLDLRQARDVAAALRVHAEQGRTLFLSIHQIIDAGRFCDRFCVVEWRTRLRRRHGRRALGRRRCATRVDAVSRPRRGVPCAHLAPPCGCSTRNGES